MRLFVSEYLCGGIASGLSASLRREGRAMLAAILADLAALPDVELVTLLGPEEASFPTGIQVVRSPHAEAYRSLFCELAADSAWSLVIAPEFDDLLLERARWVLDAGGRLLGPSPEGIALTADKLALAELLSGQDLPTPPSWDITALRGLPESWLPGVLKPRFGAGSQATYRVDTITDLKKAKKRARREWVGPLLLQQLYYGQAASVSLLIGPGRLLPMPAGRQILSTDGRFHYLGGEWPLPSHLDARARALACSAASAVAGLAGYVGVDLVLGDDPSGDEDVVIEINPRLTTSYLGLRRLARFNLAEAMLSVTEGRTPLSWDWEPGPVRFDVGGFSEPEA